MQFSNGNSRNKWRSCCFWSKTNFDQTKKKLKRKTENWFYMRGKKLKRKIENWLCKGLEYNTPIGTAIRNAKVVAPHLRTVPN